MNARKRVENAEKAHLEVRGLRGLVFLGNRRRAVFGDRGGGGVRHDVRMSG